MNRVKITLSYDGTRYHGWQIQENAVTVQGTMEKAAEKIFGEHVPLCGCSRTDAGVHAYNFVCHADLPYLIPLPKIPFAFNALLPPDIAVKLAEPVPDTFHARFSCKGKTYCYRLWNHRIRNPLEADRAGFWPLYLDADKMRAAAQNFLGKHDFSAFMATGSDVSDPVREIYAFDVKREGDMILFTVSGNGFLYNMVRIMVGTLIQGDQGKLDRSIPEIISLKDRTLAGITMPPQGLYLKMPFYDD